MKQKINKSDLRKEISIPAKCVRILPCNIKLKGIVISSKLKQSVSSKIGEAETGFADWL